LKKPLEFPEARCLLPERSAEQEKSCLAFIPMYRFDDVSKKCVNFIYGGCGGTENRFGTIKECIEFCGAKNAMDSPGKKSSI
jgi:Kunitz/Bovine pancreatic trypsin inhibitor domain